MDVLGRDANRPVPEVEQIRASVLEAYGVPRTTQASTESATVANNQQRGAGKRVKAADDETGPQEDPVIESKPVAHWVEDEVRYMLSREYIGKRKRATNDESDAAETERNGNQGHKRPCR